MSDQGNTGSMRGLLRRLEEASRVDPSRRNIAVDSQYVQKGFRGMADDENMDEAEIEFLEFIADRLKKSFHNEKITIDTLISIAEQPQSKQVTHYVKNWREFLYNMWDKFPIYPDHRNR